VRYLAAAPVLLCAVVTVLADTGIRPAECFGLRWESITWANGRHGTVLVTHGKSAAARRVLPMTPRVRAVLEARWDKAERPYEGLIFPAPTASGHIEKSTLKKPHKKVFETVREEAKAKNKNPIRRFLMYDLRHTFLTRLGESGCDAWTLARIAGHGNTRQSMRYVHPSEDSVFGAMERISGHNTGHSARAQVQNQNQRQLTQ
jgi:integrase